MGNSKDYLIHKISVVFVSYKIYFEINQVAVNSSLSNGAVLWHGLSG